MQKRSLQAENKQARILDRIDRQLLRSLQANGRKSVSELAREVHLTTTPCLERVRRLEQLGLIKGYFAQLDLNRLGLPLLAFVELRVDSTTPECCQRFKSAVDALSEVIECHKVTGDFDYFLKLRVTCLDAYRKFMDERLTTLTGIAHSRTYIVVDEVKSTTDFEI